MANINHQCSFCTYFDTPVTMLPCSGCMQVVPNGPTGIQAEMRNFVHKKVEAEESPAPVSDSSAEDFLKKAERLLDERGKGYDKGKERSMGKAVAMFNIATGKNITVAQGWLLMQLVKIVRQNTAEGFHRDSYEDDISYSALKAEAAYEGKK